MANKTVAQLATLSGVATTDLIPVYDTSETGAEKLKHISGTDMKADFISGLSTDSHDHDGTYLKDIVDDTTPQLGGDLDVNDSILFIHERRGSMKFVAKMAPLIYSVWKLFQI